MKIQVTEAQGVIVLDLEGKITIGEGDVALRETIDKLLEQNFKAILMNMARVSYMDSSGVGELVACMRRVQEAGGQLKLMNISKKIKDLLHLTQLLSFFEYFNDEETAIASFK